MTMGTNKFDAERTYNAIYSSRVKYTDGYKRLGPLISLMKEIGGWGEDAIPYCIRLQEDLYERGAIPCIIRTVDDWPKIESCNSDVRYMLRLALIILERGTHGMGIHSI